jgi:hypothetical protein
VCGGPTMDDQILRDLFDGVETELNLEEDVHR